MLRTLMRGEPVIYGRDVADATARKRKGEDGKTHRTSLKIQHWVAVVRAALQQHRIGELILDKADKKGPRLKLHLPNPEDERNMVIFHNRLMAICGITLVALSEKMSSVAERQAPVAPVVKAEVKAEQADQERAAPEPKRRRLRQMSMGNSYC